MKLALALIYFSALLLPLHADPNKQWGHWRGPTGNGTSETANPPVHWDAKKNIKWKTAIPGNGSSSPVVWGDKIFVTSAVGPVEGKAPRNKQRFTLFCIDRKNGKILWEKVAAETVPHEGHHDHHGFASASPMTDGERVFASFGSRGLFVYDMDGNLLWKRDDFGKMRTRNGFGEGSSPTLHGDTVIMPWDHEGPSKIIAIDAKTGKNRWETPRDEPTSWDTPLVVEHGGKKQVITSGEKFAMGYDFDSGKEIWRCAGQTQRPVASAVSAGGLVYIGSGFRGAFLGAFKLGAKGDLKGTKNVVWEKNRNTPDIASLLLSNGRLYYTARKSGILSCVDAKTGKPHYEGERVDGVRDLYSSPVAAAGRVYITGRDGTTAVIEDGDDLEVLATNRLGEPVDTTPALVGKEVIIRGAKHLYLISK